VLLLHDKRAQLDIEVFSSHNTAEVAIGKMVRNKTSKIAILLERQFNPGSKERSLAPTELITLGRKWPYAFSPIGASAKCWQGWSKNVSGALCRDQSLMCFPWESMSLLNMG
jgi:hypothetical protein